MEYELTIKLKYKFESADDVQAREWGSELADQILTSLEHEQVEVEFIDCSQAAVLHSLKTPGKVVWKR